MRYFKGTSKRKRKISKTQESPPPANDSSLVTGEGEPDSMAETSQQLSTLCPKSTSAGSGRGQKRPSTSKELNSSKRLRSAKHSKKDVEETTVREAEQAQEIVDQVSTKVKKGQKRTAPRSKTLKSNIEESIQHSGGSDNDGTSATLNVESRKRATSEENKTMSSRTNVKAPARRSGKSRHEQSEELSSGDEVASKTSTNKQSTENKRTSSRTKVMAPTRSSRKSRQEQSEDSSSGDEVASKTATNKKSKRKVTSRTTIGSTVQSAKGSKRNQTKASEIQESTPERGHTIRDVACINSTASDSQKDNSVFDSMADNEETETQNTDKSRQKKKSSTGYQSSASLEDSSQDRLSNRQFIQNQVTLLRKPFELEDCKEIAYPGTKGQQKKHIPQDVVKKMLRRLNNNVEDELLKHLNRQAQMKLLKTLSTTRLDHSMEKIPVSSECEQAAADSQLEVLNEQLKESTEKLINLKALTKMCGEIESSVELLKSNSLAKEVKRTNKLVDQITKKLKAQEVAPLARTITTQEQWGGGCQVTSTSHKRIVDKLFGN